MLEEAAQAEDNNIEAGAFGSGSKNKYHKHHKAAEEMLDLLDTEQLMES